MSVAIGDLVHVVEADGKKVLAHVVELGENKWGEVVAYVKKLEHDGMAYVTTNTAADGDTPVPFVTAVKSAASVTSAQLDDLETNLKQHVADAIADVLSKVAPDPTSAEPPAPATQGSEAT